MCCPLNNTWTLKNIIIHNSVTERQKEAWGNFLGIILLNKIFNLFTPISINLLQAITQISDKQQVPHNLGEPINNSNSNTSSRIKPADGTTEPIGIKHWHTKKGFLSPP